MKVHLRKRKLKNSTKSNSRYTLYLDIYFYKGKRKREFLGIYLEPQDTQTTRKEKLELAHKIKAKRMLELTNQEYGFPSKDKLKMNFVEYFEYQKNKRHGHTRESWNSAYNYLREFSGGNVPFNKVDRKWLMDFTEFISTKVALSTASTYIAKIRSALNEAVRDEIILSSPSKLVRQVKVPEKSKEYLTIEEIQQIYNIQYFGPNPDSFNEIRKAFLFACFTGIRLSDLRKLKWSNIQHSPSNGNGISYTLTFRQTKTKAMNSIPLNETALNLIKPLQNNDCLVFHFSQSNATIQRVLRKMLEGAKISKKITFHCSRHTNAIMLLANGANLMTVKELLGHKDIKATQVYAKVIDSSKQKAVAQLPSINIKFLI